MKTLIFLVFVAQTLNAQANNLLDCRSLYGVRAFLSKNDIEYHFGLVSSRTDEATVFYLPLKDCITNQSGILCEQAGLNKVFSYSPSKEIQGDQIMTVYKSIKIKLEIKTENQKMFLESLIELENGKTMPISQYFYAQECSTLP